jgi:ABC transporter-like protein cylB
MLKLILRNYKVYTRDKTALLMSFLSVIILVIIYQVFLGQLQLDVIKQIIGSDTIPDSTVKMVNLWLISGLTTIISMTSTLGTFGVMVSDREKKIAEDLEASPISKFKLEMSYAVFAIVFGSILTLISCIFAMILFNGFDSLLVYAPIDFLKIFGIILLSAAASVAIVMPILSVISTNSAFTALSTIIGTLIGFISGVYISIGSVGDVLRQVMTWFPLTHINALLKQVLMKSSIEEVFNKAPVAVADKYRESYGVTLVNPSGEQLSVGFMLMYIVLVTAALVTIGIIIRRVKR